MALYELIDLLKKRGLRDTFTVLVKFKNYKAEKRKFYDELNKFSYYNSFFRVRSELIEKGLLSVVNNQGKKYYSLTKKGINVYNRLVEIDNIINDTN